VLLPSHPVPKVARSPVERIPLGQGLTLVHHHLPASAAVVMDVWLDAGARVEPSAWSGMAHFLEHMIFKGTDRIAPGEFDLAVEGRGGMTNAATSHDYAHYFVTSAVQDARVSLPLLADLLQGAIIPAAEFERERSVVLEELRQAQDNPDWVAFQSLLEGLYPHHAYGRSVLGTIASVMGITPEAMRQFHRCYYQPERVVVAIAGGMGREEACDLVSSAFSSFGAPGDCPAPEVGRLDAIAQVHRQTLHLPYLETARLMMAWLLPGPVPIADTHALDLLSVLLSEGRTSRLVRELREERQLVQSIGCDCSTQREASVFFLTAWLDGDHLEMVEAIALDRLEDVKGGAVSEFELARAKRLLCNDYAFSTETPSQLASCYGYYALMGHFEEVLHYGEHVKAVTVADLVRVAQAYLPRDRYAVTELLPI
jgi:zinc protease